MLILIFEFKFKFIFIIIINMIFFFYSFITYFQYDTFLSFLYPHINFFSSSFYNLKPIYVCMYVYTSTFLIYLLFFFSKGGKDISIYPPPHFFGGSFFC